ncbi:thermonuclease family protein [Corynebacterium appendicis]|uniref:thermonuclease family protein n=1 Tax=Corynebacterium appendicis TaxID=163202 RepID=UPI002357C0E1|nr:thermonuclease family protein [Corynebacterium appendicis]
MKKWIAGIGAVALVGAGAAAAVVVGSDTTVERVVDGDTVDVSTWSGTKRVRLLNIDTPELGHFGEPEECLAQEAKDRLEELLPAGTKVTLEYDVDRHDRYGRELAGVFVGDDFVNEQIVSEGFAHAVVFEPNRKFYDRILAAEASPRSNQTGVFGVGPECLTSDRREQSDLESTQRDIHELDRMDLADPMVTADARRLVDRIHRTSDDIRRHADSTEDSFYTAQLRDFLDASRSRADEAERELDATDKRERERIEDMKKQEQEAQQREARQREEARREAEHQRAAEQPPAPAPAPAPAPSAPSGGADTYTGCRAYGGNYSLNNVDKNGRRYAKIDCNTKEQIG